VLFELCIFELYKERTETDSRATKLSTRCSIVQKDMFKKYSYLFYSVLNTVLEEEGEESDVIIAIGHVAKAIGMTKIAEETGLSRSSLYKALSNGSKPQFTTIVRVLKAIGGQIQINPI